MPLVTSKQLVEMAEKGSFAVGAFNAVNMESTQAIFGAAEETRSPFILQVTQTTLDYTAPEELAAMIFSLAERATVPVAVHLDHGRSFELVMKFLRLGFTSVMIDGSLQADGKTPRSYEENVAVTRKVVDVAHAMGVTVEAEIGRLGQIGQEISGSKSDALTDPEEAAQFVKDTGVDLLAVSIGTRHGLFKGKPIIAHDRVAAIRKATGGMPLVMHGGTGVPDEDVQKGIQLGIRKVNIDTQIRVAFYDSVIESIHKIEKDFAEADTADKTRKYDIRSILKPARASMKTAIAGRMRVFGSVGKADAAVGKAEGRPKPVLAGDE